MPNQENITNNQKQEDSIETEQENKDWTDIHEDFSKEWNNGKTYQQIWEKKGFTHEETKKWITTGFEPKDYWIISQWKEEKFTPQQTKKWTEISKKFTPKSKKNWEEHGFTCEQAKKWVEVLKEKFKVSDWGFCIWLRNEKNLTAQKVKQQDNYENLRSEYNKLWTDIHEDFNEDKNQEDWENQGFTYQETQEWVKVEFYPGAWINSTKYNCLPSYWKNKHFTLQEVKSWIDTGLKKDDYEFATYLRDKGIQPSKDLELERLRIDYLFREYPKEKRKETVELKLRSKNLQGDLDLNDFVNLKELDLWGNKLTSLNINNCSNLTKLSCVSNNLTSINLPNNLSNLRELELHDNNFNQDLSFLEGAINLEKLVLDDNKFHGSLKYLKGMEKLRGFSISNTDIDSGLEYLPKSIKGIDCRVEDNKRKDAKVKIIEEIYKCFNGSLKEIRESSSIQEWFNKNGRTYIRKWYSFDKSGSAKISKVTVRLDIGHELINWRKEDKNEEKEKLKVWLIVKDFADPEVFNFSGCQLTCLFLLDYSQPIELRCDGNKLKSLDFLRFLSNPEKLEKLYLQNNPNLVVENLDSLSKLTNLKELNLNDCGKNLKGSLKSLEKMKKLEKISINHTNISEGLEYLPDSCKELYCELDYDYSSVRIANQLTKFSKGEGKYDLIEWRTDKANSSTVLVIPLERLFVIRGNLKQFLKKWGSEDNQTGQTQLSQLKDPEQFSRFKYLSVVGYLSTTASVAGGSLTLIGTSLGSNDYTTAGGVITLVSPLIGAASSQFKTSLYDERNKKWTEFLDNTDTFLDNFNELLGIIRGVKFSKWGKVNKTLQELNKEVNEFLNVYDKNDDREIDIDELRIERPKFSKQLDKVEKIVDAIRALEKVIIDYKQGIPIETTNEDQLKVADKEENKIDGNKKEENADKNQESTTMEKNNKIFLNLIDKIKVKDEEFTKLKDLIDKDFKKKWQGKKISLLLKPKKEDDRYLVISFFHSQPKKNTLSYLTNFLPNWLSGWFNKNFSLDLVKKNDKGGLEIEIDETNKLPRLFSSKEETIKAVIKIIETGLEESYKKSIDEEIKKNLEEENEKNKRIIFEERVIEKEWSKLINLLEKHFSDKIDKEESSWFWLNWFKQNQNNLEPSDQIEEVIKETEDKEVKQQELKDNQLENQEWFDTFPDLDPEQDSDFIIWLKDIKSKEIENYTDPKWVKEKIDTKELKLNELKEAYQEHQEEVVNKNKSEVTLDIEEEVNNSSSANLLNESEAIEMQNLQQQTNSSANSF